MANPITTTGGWLCARCNTWQLPNAIHSCGPITSSTPYLDLADSDRMSDEEYAECKAMREVLRLGHVQGWRALLKSLRAAGETP